MITIPVIAIIAAISLGFLILSGYFLREANKNYTFPYGLILVSFISFLGMILTWTIYFSVLYFLS